MVEVEWFVVAHRADFWDKMILHGVPQRSQHRQAWNQIMR
jgi:hypothetical protein